MKPIASAIAVLMLSTLPSLAAGIPIEITADTFTVEQGNRTATFSGNVVIKRLDLDLRAATVTVVYGTGGESDIDSLSASGNVRVKSSGQQASGDRASFDPDTQIVRLSGNVTVSNAQGSLKGPELTIDLKKNTSVFKGSEGGRVTGVFTPQ